MIYKVLKLIVICLVATEVLARETQSPHSASPSATQTKKQTQPAVRRPNEYLQPPPPPPPSRIVTPASQRRPPTRLRSIHVSGPPSVRNVHHSPTPPPAETGRQTSPPTGNGQHPSTASGNHNNPIERHVHAGPGSPRHGLSPGKGTSSGKTPPVPNDRHVLGPAGNSLYGESPGNTGRLSRWFFSSEESEAQGERKPNTNDILRPPPPSPHTRTHSFPTNVQPVQSPVEQISSETHQHRAIVPYRAHSQPHHQPKPKECNPCNKVPWIPMPRAHSADPYHGSSETVSNAHASTSNQYLPPAPLPSQYESPSIASLPLESPGTEYGAPLPPLQSPGGQYGPPPPPPIKLSDGQYAVPPPLSQQPGSAYGPPQTPNDEYGPPPPVPHHIQSEYKPPPPPVSENQNEHSDYKPPPLQQQLGTQYGPPQQHPGTEYGAPAPSKLPEPEYGPPPPPPQPPRIEFGPSASNYKPLPPPPQPPRIVFGPSASNYKPPPPPPQPPRIEFGPSASNYKPPPPPSDQYGLPPPPLPHDAVKQPSSPQLAPSFLPAPPVYEPERFKETQQSSVPHYLIPPPHPGSNDAFNTLQNIGGLPDGKEPGNGHHEIDVVQSVSLLEDSHPVASQHPTTSGSRDVGYTAASAVHLVPDASTTAGYSGNAWHKDETTSTPNDQLHLPSRENYQPQGQKNFAYNSHQLNRSQESSLEVIPSIQVADYLSSVEYPLQIVQSPYIDVTEPSGHIVKNINEQQSYDNQAPSHGQPTFDDGEIIIGKPVLSASNLNDSNIKSSYENINSSDSHDQKQQQSAIHETNAGHNTEDRPPELSHQSASGVKNSLSGNGFFSSENHVKPVTEDTQEGQSHINVNLLGDISSNKRPSASNGHVSTTFDIQPSVQTSAEGNSLIHQINNVFQSNPGLTTLPPFQNTFKQSQSSGYVLFQNFPQPPLSYLPADVLKQQLPPPTPFQSTFQQNPYLPTFQSQGQSSHFFVQSTPQPPTTPFEHALKLEAPLPFLNPPPKSNEEYSTVTNTPAPDYSFWTPTSRPFSSSLSPVNSANTWITATTIAPQVPIKLSNQNVIAAFAEAAGLLPPPPSLPEATNQSNKKTKQIQIIVPYTSSKELMQFKIQENNKPLFDTTGWLPITGNEDNSKQQGRKVPTIQVNCSDNDESWQKVCKNSSPLSWQQQNDYHQHQESRTVTATAPIVQSAKEISQSNPHKSYSEIQHIFATNIRDLLRGEEDIKKVPDTLTLQRLQKNIDEWTALEYSKRKDIARVNNTRNFDEGRKSTTATTSSGTSFHHLLVPSKKIPEEYLTTTPSIFDDVTQTENSVATAIPNFKKIRNTTPSTTSTTSTKRLLSPFYDHEVSSSHTHTVRTVSDTNNRSHDRRPNERDSAQRINIQDTPLNHQRKGENHKWKIIESNYIIPEAIAATTKKPTTISSTTTTTTTPQTTTAPLDEIVTDIYTNTGHTTWDQIPLSISPITNEKVYVVTPVTTWIPDTTTSKPYRTSPYTVNSNIHSTSINDVFPFRNGPPSVQKLIVSAPFSFKSPRFIIRPTPGTTVHRSFTVTSLDDEDDGWNDLRTTTLEPVKLNEINEDADLEKNSTVQDTTTTPTMTPTPSQNHLLLGLPHLPTYTPPNGTRVQTDSGHSKVVTVVNTATVASPLRKKPIKKQTTVATTKLFPVTTTKPHRGTHLPLPQPRGGLRKLRPNRGSYMWQFPELSGHSLLDEDAEAVQGALVELKKEKTS